MGKQVTFSLAAIYYPSNIQWGLILSEDKQIETALMLATAGLLVARPAPRGQLKPRRELVLALCVAALTVLPFLLYFDLSFIRLVLDRLMHGVAAGSTAMHGAPWQLLPFSVAYYARPLTCIILMVLAVLAFARGRLDALNFSACIGVIWVCLWMVGGSMDRMNIAMMFALFCAATISIRFWQTFVLFNFIAQLLIYTTLIARTRWVDFFDPETPDALATTIFVTCYVGLLAKECLGARQHGVAAVDAPAESG